MTDAPQEKPDRVNLLNRQYNMQNGRERLEKKLRNSFGIGLTYLKRQAIIKENAPDLHALALESKISLNQAWELYRARIGKPVPPRISIPADIRIQIAEVAEGFHKTPNELVKSILLYYLNGPEEDTGEDENPGDENDGSC